MLEAADRLLRGEWEVLGVLRTDLVRPDWFCDPVTGRRSDRGPLRVPDQPPLRGADRQRQAGLGDLPPAAPHAAGHGLVPQPRRGIRPPGGGPAALLVAGEPVPVGRELDERHRDRHPPDQLDLDQAPPGRMARSRRPFRERRAHGPADPLAPAVPLRLQKPGLVGQQPRHRGGCRAARGQLRLPVVRRKRPLAAEVRPAPRARADPQHLPVGYRPRARHRLPVFRRGTRSAGRQSRPRQPAVR